MSVSVTTLAQPCSCSRATPKMLTVGGPAPGTQGQSRVGMSHLTLSHGALGPCPAEDKQSGLREFDLQVSLPTVTAGGRLLQWVELSRSGPLSWVHFPQLTLWGPSPGLLPGGCTPKAALLLPSAIPLRPGSPTLRVHRTRHAWTRPTPFLPLVSPLRGPSLSRPLTKPRKTPRNTPMHCSSLPINSLVESFSSRGTPNRFRPGDPFFPVNPFLPVPLQATLPCDFRVHPSRPRSLHSPHPSPRGSQRPYAPCPLHTEVQKLLHGQRGGGELAEVLEGLGRPCQGRILQQRADPAHGCGTAARVRGPVPARVALALGSAQPRPA